MISVKQLLIKLDLRLNKLATNQHQSIPYEEAILALNEAQIKLIKSKVIGDNPDTGLDSFKKRYEDLQSLVVPMEELSCTKGTITAYSTYNADLSKLSKKYMLPLDMAAICSKGTCKSRPVYITRVIKHGDISVMMTNSNTRPSFEYEETLGLISSNTLTVYTDTTFTVDKVLISYLRYPIEMDIAGYQKLDGSPSTDVDCELADYLENELLDLATLELGMNTENEPVIQTYPLRKNNT